MKRVLLVADQPGWIFDRHCYEIKKRLDGEFKVKIGYRRNDIKAMSDNFDLVYLLDPMAMKSWPDPEKTIMGLRCEFMYRDHPEGARGLYEKGMPGYGSPIKEKCSMLHVVNQNQYDAFKDIVTDKPLVIARHGVDETIFDRSKYDKRYNETVAVGVSGRSSKNKGFGFIQKACNKTGLNFITVQFGGSQLSKEEMPSFYSNLDVYVCMSKTEGLNNGSMEAGAMGLPIISTRSGAAEEMIRDGENGFLVDRDVDALADALEKMKDEDRRIDMGNKFHEEIMNNWTWDVRIDDFRKMFNEFLNKER